MTFLCTTVVLALLAQEPLPVADGYRGIWTMNQPSKSFLYFTNRSGDHVWELPPIMDGDSARPERLR